MVSALERRFGVLLLLGAACTTDLSGELEGLECRAPDRKCLGGYVCNADNRCVRSGLQQDGGASGTGEGGAAGAAQLPAGGSSSDPSDAGGGGFRYDAGPGLDTLDASVLPDAQACATRVPLFRDEDEDGFGVTAQQVLGCPPLEKWALRGGDCRDDLPQVHPEQVDFFPVGYPDPTRPSAGNVSFDYDCDFIEELEPNSVKATACGDLITCEGSGYVAASPARSGPGINAICGSTELNVCQSRTVPILGLTCEDQPLSGAPARCQ
jgi:hypothetical protein